jgi:UDP-N-acetylmuramoylalanine-D-glutamate ligase
MRTPNSTCSAANKSDYAIFSSGMASSPRLDAIEAQKVFFKPGNDFEETSLFGEHNQANLAAAWQAALLFGVGLDDARRAAKEFKAIEHRLEMVGEKKGVLFVNDSKSTTVESLRVALTAMSRPVLLLAGGVSREEILPRLPPHPGKVKAIGLFGASREIFEPAWGSLAPITWSETMQEAVNKLMTGAAPGDVMLLSPATASFDLYANYKARGNEFKRIWENLQ